MKKLIFTFLIILIASSLMMAQTTVTVSGTVTNSANNSPIANQQMTITIIDSLSSFYFVQAVNTNPFGVYSLVVQNYPLGSPIIVRTQDCNNNWQFQYPNANNSYVGNFSIYVGSPASCQANFACQVNPTNPLAYQFTNLSTGSPTNYLWNFGDNTTSTLQNPNHTYAQSGTFIVSLSISGPGCQNTYSILITAGSGPTCQAAFTSTPDSSASLGVQFHDQSFGNPTSWNWDFGDNTSSTSQHPHHVYSQIGYYIVTLNISQQGCQSTFTDTVKVGYNPYCGANFISYPDSSNPMLIYFQDISTGYPTSWTWSFGDGTSSSLQNPTHTYSQSGIYSVSLNVSGSSFCNSFTYKTISVNTSPTSGSISGLIYTAPPYFSIYNGLVYLIEFDSITNNLTAIDTTTVDSSNHYVFNNVSHGSYYVKAALSSTSPYYNSYFPTYYIHELLWSNATTVNLNSLSAWISIKLIAGNNPGGPGFIGGNVLQGANKGSNDPMEGIEVMLLDMSENPITKEITDVNGSYGFNNLAYGDYKVWIDIPGKTTTPAVVTIDATTPSVTNINMIINSTTIVAGIEKSPSIFDRSVGEIYPNPSFDNSKLEINLMEAARVDVSIFKSIGQLIRTNTYELSTGKNLIEINSSELVNGIYTIRLESNIGQAYRKFVKVSK